MLQEQLGFLKSYFIYRLKPFQHTRLKRFYSQILRPGDLAFDLGSHMGNRIVAWREIGAKVVAVEPHPTLAARLRKEFSDDSEVFIEEKGVNQTGESQHLKISHSNPTMSSFSEEWQSELQQSYPSLNWNRSVECQMVTLDELMATYGKPQFIKIDVEGYEYEVLSQLKEPVASLSFEVIPAAKQSFFRCLNHLDKVGDYEFNFSKTETMRWSYANWLTADEISATVDKMPVLGRSGDVYCRLKELQA